MNEGQHIEWKPSWRDECYKGQYHHRSGSTK